MSDQDAGGSESDRRKNKKRSKAEKKDKARKDKVHGSVSTDPVPVLVDGPLSQCWRRLSKACMQRKRRRMLREHTIKACIPVDVVQ